MTERPPILRRYLDKVPGARPHIPVDRHAPMADLMAVCTRYPVYLVVVDAPGDAPATGQPIHTGDAPR